MAAAVATGGARPRVLKSQRSQSEKENNELLSVKRKSKPTPLRLPSSSMQSFDNLENGPNSGPISAGGPKTPTAIGEVKEKKIGHRRVDNTTGQVTYKKKATSDLMRAIQLGIGQSVGKLSAKPTRDVLMQDFAVVETVTFPENGGSTTPAHKVGDFKFKTYAPVAFRYFRELFNIRSDDFLVSLSVRELIELSNPGASGSVFFISEDDEFIIKTVQHKEAEFLQKLLPGYYMNLNQNPRTLLPKFYGLYIYMQGGKNIRLIVMNNLLPMSIRLSEKYDLKGSTFKRKASKHELSKSAPTYKDLDFRERHPEGIMLEAETYEALIKTIKRDCRVLESFKIMDYSLLLCMYNVDEARRKKRAENLPGGTETGRGDETPGETGGASSSQPTGGAEATPGPIRSRASTKRLQNFGTALDSINAQNMEPVELEDDDDVPPGGIPARNANGDRLLLYCGIIDILQSYRLQKKLEHGFKSILYDGDAISVTKPKFYSERFVQFFESHVFRKVQSRLRASSRISANQTAMRTPSKKRGIQRQRSMDPDEGQLAPPEGAAAGSSSRGRQPDLIPQVVPLNPPNSESLLYQRSQTTTSTSGSYSTHERGPDQPQHSASEYTLPDFDDPLPPYTASTKSNAAPEAQANLLESGSGDDQKVDRSESQRVRFTEDVKSNDGKDAKTNNTSSPNDSPEAASSTEQTHPKHTSNSKEGAADSPTNLDVTASSPDISLTVTTTRVVTVEVTNQMPEPSSQPANQMPGLSSNEIELEISPANEDHS